jgi:hypothetical protein
MLHYGKMCVSSCFCGLHSLVMCSKFRDHGNANDELDDFAKLEMMGLQTIQTS